MSCDYSVWHTNSRLNSVEAQALYLRLCEGDVSGIVPHPSIDAFYDELTARHPEIDDVPEDRLEDTDLCPWSIAFDRSDGHLIMCCAWSKAVYVGNLLLQLASKHGLALYDPQSERIFYSSASQVAKPWWKFWLH